MKHFNFEHPEEFERVFRGNTPEVNDAIVESISEAFQFQKDQAEIFSISFGEQEVAYEITLPKKQWATAIQKCLDNYHEWERHDEAIDTYLLLKNIKEWVTEQD
jgi:hypothetical protein|tara:strand:+ start:133 stop:444 length:312 start_codon:yes stop_codon:yes gene_type:complete